MKKEKKLRREIERDTPPAVEDHSLFGGGLQTLLLAQRPRTQNERLSGLLDSLYSIKHVTQESLEAVKGEPVRRSGILSEGTPSSTTLLDFLETQVALLSGYARELNEAL